MFEPQKPALTRKSLILHPNGGFSFGTVPAMPAYGLPGGDIYLKYGEHRGHQKGWGAHHIWSAHQKDFGFKDFDEVSACIARIVTPGARIYCEFSNLKNGPRVAVLRSEIGLMIIEHRPLKEKSLAYSVITAYPKRNAHGKLVGKI